MRSDLLTLPCPERIRAQVLEALRRYWPMDSEPISELPIEQQQPPPKVSGPLCLIKVKLPVWATEIGVNGHLLVPREVDTNEADPNNTWKRLDWWLAAFLLLEAWHERVWEHENGPIHAYSFRLIGWDERAWQHAWVNRIGLFLRAWAIQRESESVKDRLGPLPKPEVQMTHDVDAVRKTLPIRLKQGIFNLFNAGRALRKGDLANTFGRLRYAYRFLFGQEDWWLFDSLLAAEQQTKIRATFHFHAGPRPKTLKHWLLDPGYDLQAPRQRALLQQLNQAGHQIGLHPGFDSWQDPKKIFAARQSIEQAAGISVTHCRQHWLRFSWRDTWSAQTCAGLTQDTTLMFNDRPGYRTSSALSWRPWNPIEHHAHRITATPTVLMDSHCYDYQPMAAQQRRQAIQRWLGECQAVHGKVAVLWHPHTLSEDYGWTDGFRDTLSTLKEITT
jgi:hypothetical protein